MMVSPIRAAWFSAALLSTAVLAACGGDDGLAPPDGSACTAGSVAPGDSVVGAVTSTSCEAFDAQSYVVTSAESWTLHAKKGVGYVIRTRHQSGTGLADSLAYDLEIYGRNAQGDMNFLTGWWDSFGATNGNGGYNEEMFFTPGTDRTVSIRVSAYTKADTGAYSLVVASCPMKLLDTPADTATMDLALGCEALSLDALPMRVSMFGFEADSNVQDTTVITRTTGAASFVSWASSPGFDLNNWTDDNQSNYVDFGTSATHYLTPDVPAQVAGWAAIRADSAATVSIAIGATPPTAPPALVHAPTAQIVGHRKGRN